MHIDERLEALEKTVDVLGRQRRAAEKKLGRWRMGATATLIGALLLWPEVGVATPPQQSLAGRVEALEELLGNFSIVTSQTGSDIYIDGANLHIRNGNGFTQTTNGLGNLIVGYNEDPGSQTGSHNVLIGSSHEFTSFGGLVAGLDNEISGEYASVSGGAGNIASGDASSVSGGGGNVASNSTSSVSGGAGNIANGLDSSVSGGWDNTAFGTLSSVSGGEQNTASGYYSSVSGGSVNTASGYGSSVSGGAANTADGEGSSVSGGSLGLVSGDFDWRAGDLFQDD